MKWAERIRRSFSALSFIPAVMAIFRFTLKNAVVAGFECQNRNGCIDAEKGVLGRKFGSNGRNLILYKININGLWCSLS